MAVGASCQTIAAAYARVAASYSKDVIQAAARGVGLTDEGRERVRVAGENTRLEKVWGGGSFEDAVVEGLHAEFLTAARMLASRPPRVVVAAAEQCELDELGSQLGHEP